MYEKNIIPLLTGDYPDPTIVEFRGKFYMTHTAGRPLIWESEDLIHWKPLCRATNAFVYIAAPELNRDGDKLFLFLPANETNYVLTSEDMLHWTDPLDLRVGSIDPGYIKDRKTGRQYLHIAAGGMAELSEDVQSASKAVHNYDGWEFPRDWDVEGYLCVEAPKLFYKEPYYYMTTAEGGTAGPSTSHMCVSARSLHPNGPWENSPYNPIVHCESDEEQWWTKGHGTVVKDHNENWWIIYHAYEKGNHNLGRQTIMQPLKWTEDGWYVVDETKDYSHIRPAHPDLSDDFIKPGIGWQWQFEQEYNDADFKAGEGSLVVRAKGRVFTDSNLCSVNPMDKEYTTQVYLEPSDGAFGSFTYCYHTYQNRFMYSGFWYGNGELHFRVDMYGTDQVIRIPENPQGIWLRMEKVRQNVRFYYSLDREVWTKFETSIDVTGYNHNTLGGYGAPRITLGAMGTGSVIFRDFRYTGKGYDDPRK